ncbi:hypothetical protein Hypma_003165 [Hypsizygus marmoreus]|uniref:Uncharacterized protein n=1 Tax=Hypsizygus marmoreus TaxID=39966 RepID=A0A369JZ63_HYPMA|nr:hypothetical protein Hypma_003165 [Hypsizygus marmoreus]
MAGPGGVGVVAVGRRSMFSSPWRRRRRGIIIISGAPLQGQAPAQQATPASVPSPSYNTNGDAEKQAEEKIVSTSSGSVSPQVVEVPSAGAY